MITSRMLFHRGMVLCGRAVEPGEFAPVPAELVREFVSSGSAELAPEEPALPPAPPLTTASMGLEPEAEALKKGGRR